MPRRGAQQGDITGQFELATLFREGKGTAPDAIKAKYWADQSGRSRELDLWRRLNAKDAGGMSTIDFAAIVATTMSQIIALANGESSSPPCNRQVNNCNGAPPGPSSWSTPTIGFH